MADDLLLASVRVMPRRLLESGYRFQYGDLLTCLTHELRP
jgi:NAD dependent epimerase/dehydratase family enzyme